MFRYVWYANKNGASLLLREKFLTLSLIGFGVKAPVLPVVLNYFFVLNGLTL